LDEKEQRFGYTVALIGLEPRIDDENLTPAGDQQPTGIRI
jgi:hypothetical protein